MSEEKQGVTVGTQQVRWKDIEFPSVYANVFGLFITPVDITIVLGEIASADASAIDAVPRMKLVLAPEFATTFLAGVANGVRIFTESHGPLRSNATPLGNRPDKQ
jgi:hypothetical protein